LHTGPARRNARPFLPDKKHYGDLSCFSEFRLFISPSYRSDQLEIGRLIERETIMDRRAFVLGIMGVTAATTVLIGSAVEAEAAPLPVARPEGADEASRLESDFRPEVDGEAKPLDAQYYYYRRPRRVYYRPRYRRRRVYYRPRRVVYRRRYYRRRYYW
jgi:hypothetical protein